MTAPAPDIVCIGAVLWDIIGRAPSTMAPGADVPGRITQLPGGVALNVAMTLRRFRLTPTLLTAIGEDDAGNELLAACARAGIRTEHVFRSAELPTDCYVAIEDANGLVAAIADAHSLERAGANILRPLLDGRLGTAAHPWAGLVALDGNLTEALIAEIAVSPLLAAADLRVVPASPGKVERLRPLLGHPRATFYLNREEAGRLCHGEFADASAAAQALLDRGIGRVIVTDGARAVADGRAGEAIIAQSPPSTRMHRVTGAGDTFTAAHLVAERNGANRADALAAALRAASNYVAGEIGS